MLPGHPHRDMVASLNICEWGVGCHAQTGRKCQSYDPGDSYVYAHTHITRSETWQIWIISAVLLVIVGSLIWEFRRQLPHRCCNASQAQILHRTNPLCNPYSTFGLSLVEYNYEDGFRRRTYIPASRPRIPAVALGFVGFYVHFRHFCSHQLEPRSLSSGMVRGRMVL